MKNIRVKKRNGLLEDINLNKINKSVERACEKLSSVSASEIVLDASIQLYDGIPTKEIDKLLILSARAKIEKEPEYSYVAARLLLNNIYKEVFAVGVDKEFFEEQHRVSFIKNIKFLVENDKLDKRLLEFDLEFLSQNLDIKRDKKFKYLGIQTLYDRYFIHVDGFRKETPQAFFMRVAMGLALNEGTEKNQKAIDFYNVISQFLYMPSTPTLFNSGTIHSQLSSCYLSTMHDSDDGIMGTIHDQAKLSKYAGGIGLDASYIRGANSYIRGTNGISDGIIPFLKILNDTLVAWNQCFAPETIIYTSNGPKQIKDISNKDLLLNSDGEFRKFDCYCFYQKKSPMVKIRTQCSVEPIKVCENHPIYTLKSNSKNLSYVEAKDLNQGDLVALSIPIQSKKVFGFQEDDAIFYGMMLGCGSFEENSNNCKLSFATENYLPFVRRYLKEKGITYHEEVNSSTYSIKWVANDSIPFSRKDIYNKNNQKNISSKFVNIQKDLVSKIIKGLVWSSGAVSENQIHFYNQNKQLIEDLKYQCLRIGVPVSVFLRQPNNYDCVIPAYDIIAKEFDLQSIGSCYDKYVLVKVESNEKIEPTETVYDFVMDGPENYCTADFIAHNGGKRKGAGCAYLEVSHIDFEDFVDLKKKTGDERRRTHDMNTACWVSDLFMKKVEKDEDWYLFSPDETPELHDLYGKSYEEKYNYYVEQAKSGKIKNFRIVKAKDIMRRILKSLAETGHPWICFKDASNITYSNKNAGVIHSSNLCTEILRHTIPTIYKYGAKDIIGETAVCNLGSINYLEHLNYNEEDDTYTLDYNKLEQTIKTAIRMLDNVIDLNYYPIPEAENSNKKHRPIGLGTMGFVDVLHAFEIPYESQDAVLLANQLQEFVSYHAIKSSIELAKIRGPFSTYQGSEWSKGNLPQDMFKKLNEERGGSEVYFAGKLPPHQWDELRVMARTIGVRNASILAIAPTATISYICGCRQSIEPDYSSLFVYSTLSGDFTMVDEWLVRKMKKMNLWNSDMVHALKLADGDVSKLPLPEEIKNQFKTAFNIDYRFLVEAAAHRQQWIDMSQSFNIYYNGDSLKQLANIYVYCWKRQLKTTYYLRTKGASQVEKSTVENVSNKISTTTCSVNSGQICESCQ